MSGEPVSSGIGIGERPNRNGASVSRGATGCGERLSSDDLRGSECPRNRSDGDGVHAGRNGDDGANVVDGAGAVFEQVQEQRPPSTQHQPSALGFEQMESNGFSVLAFESGTE